MAGYLYLNDYKTYIQGVYLNQLVQGDDGKRVTEENVSVQTIAQRLQQKYDLDLEFRKLTVWDKTKTYSAWDRVYIDISASGFAQWVTATSYVVGDPVYYNGYGYYCLTANSDVTFTPAKWTKVGARYDIFYAAFPSTCTLNGQPNPSTLTAPYAPVFNYKNLYSKDDVVYWKGNTYVCASASTVLSHQAQLQYSLYTNIPYNNVFPDDPVNNNNEQYWKDETAYVVEAGTPLTDSAWVAGDNRNQNIKDAMITITVWKLSPLIAPSNRPANWLEDYRGIMRDLGMAARGEITLNLPMKQPYNAVRTYNGGNIKNINSV